MTFYRVTATYKNDGLLEEGCKIVLLCKTDKGKVTSGEWFGYAQEDSVKYPFILHKGIALLYGDEDNFSESTDFGKINLVKGNVVTVTTSSRVGEPVEYKYEITHVHAYDG